MFDQILYKCFLVCFSHSVFTFEKKNYLYTHIFFLKLNQNTSIILQNKHFLKEK